MQTSQQWWEQVKANPTLLENWLKDQYHGEVTAAARIREIADKTEGKVKALLNVIAKQEERHALWVGSLLATRGITPEVLQKDERYWSKTLPENYKSMPIEKLAAIGAHAEAMRLERIITISSDESAPSDIRAVFQQILPEERFHEREFSRLAGDEEMKKALDAHKEGLAALGLTI